jgi:nucleotide-binding universal stress UspA family protein
MTYSITKILAPTDFSDHAAHAFGYARTFADRWNAELHLLNVIEPAVFPTEAGLTPIGMMKLTEELENAAHANLKSLAERETMKGLTVETAVAHGRASSAIIDYATIKEIDMIVLATHGRRGLEHLIFGSTAERVVREAPCPVLTVRPPDTEHGNTAKNST